MQFPRIVPDRDRYRKWYLDETVEHTLHNGHKLIIRDGYRFNGHSTRPLHWLFAQYDQDIYAALIHDYLLDTMPWHRYSRRFIDREYKLLMDIHSWGLRKAIMPRIVTTWGFIKTFGWRDFRGKQKAESHLEVVVRYN